MFRKRIALGIATAALAVSSFASPFMSAANAQFLFKPDVRVNYDHQFHYSEKDVYYFRVKDIGAASASPVTLIARCYYLNTNGSIGHKGDIFLGVVSLQQDQQIMKSVTCPKESAHSVYARVKAIVPDDLDESNNIAYAPNPLNN
jgi:hypothetical protein